MTTKMLLDLQEYASDHGMTVCDDHGGNAVVLYTESRLCSVCIGTAELQEKLEMAEADLEK